ncbi:MAG: alpha/beta fold hydrolase [Pirellulales bacterium]
MQRIVRAIAADVRAGAAIGQPIWSKLRKLTPMLHSSGFPARTQGTARRRRALVAGVALILAALAAGCASTQYVKLRSVPNSPLAERLKLTARGGPQPSDRTLQILRQYDLTRDVKGNPQPLVDKFQAIVSREPSAEKVYCFAELSFLAGKKLEQKEPAAALDHYGAAVTHAYLYLFDERYAALRNPYDPQFRAACDLYNGALEGALRIVKKQGDLLPGCTHTIQTATQSWDVTVVARPGNWQQDDFERFEFVSDYEVQGLTNQYQSFGLGVPLIAVRKQRPQQGPSERFYPPQLSFAVTAFLRVLPEEMSSAGGGSRRHLALLELYDPLVSTHVEVVDRRVPLESDLSTPLAYCLNDPQLNALAEPTAGLLRPAERQAVTGLYMLEPHQPGKIPVLMVHGLWSNPLTWMEMFNDLRSLPEIRERYQFWFYLYPTGEPFWNSAARLRQQLAEVRALLDPAADDPALGQMVLVGHSMGGLISKLQTVDSGNEFWNIVSDQPFQVVKASPEARQRLARTFFFEPDPGIRRVVTIGTPHRGSNLANRPARWLAQKLISLPRMPLMVREQLYRDNPGVFRDDTIIQVKTSVDSLAPDSPILPVLLEAPHPDWVAYHNIVGVLPNEGWLGSLAAGSDGLVTYESAHLDAVASEITVNAHHSTVHRHPLTVLEVRRILLEHLAEVDSLYGGRTTRARGGQRLAGATR